MKYLNEFSQMLNLREYHIIGGLILIALLIAGIFILLNFLKRKNFMHHLEKAINNPDYISGFRTKYPNRYLLKKSSLIEKLIEKQGESVLKVTGIADLWINELKVTKKRKHFTRILKYAPDKGLFACFLASLENKRLASELVKWLKNTGDFLYLRKLALSGKGENFDGREALNTFRDKIDEIREMTGDPEWPSRYFALKILLHDGDKRSVRAIWDTLNDPYPLIRKTAISEFQPEESQREEFFKKIYEILLNDPVYEVRQEAWKRIKRDFRELYTLNLEDLKDEQLLRALEILDPNSDEDENTALKIFEREDPETGYYAAKFLERTGTLRRLLLDAELGDMELTDRNYTILKKAAGLNVVSFLEPIEEIKNPASLYIASKILREDGPRNLVGAVAKRIFTLARGYDPAELKNFLPVYREIVKTIHHRGTDSACHLLLEELKHNLNNKKTEILLSYIPHAADYIFIDYLIDLLKLKEPDFEYDEGLIHAISQISPSLYMDKITQIILSGRGKYPHRTRINAIKILGEIGGTQTLQFLLENLPILPLEEAKEFMKTISKYSGEKLSQKAEKLLEGIDSKIRATLISALPPEEQRKFSKIIKKTLDDPDPEVRIASIFALSHIKEGKSSLERIGELLRDPVERVRIAAAKTIAEYPSREGIKLLKETLYSDNEVDSVKNAILEGLGNSDSTGATDLLLEVIENIEGLRDNAVEALAQKTSKKSIKHLVECFKDADPRVRDSITEAFKLMGEEGEAEIEALLREEISSLQPYIAEILEETGYVESKIRKLKHRNSEERIKAAEILSLIATPAAFRGIVLASRDPNREVRVKVVKALEKLESEEGKDILKDLENDPDKKIRKYTQWALERLRSKSLV